MSGPCSSQVYQERPTPASWETSSRRKPKAWASKQEAGADSRARPLTVVVQELGKLLAARGW